MTNISAIAHRLFRKIKWQEVPEEVGQDDLIELVRDAIRKLYVISGRTFQFSEDKFQEIEGDSYEWSFEDDLMIDEIEWILLESQIEFYKTCQSNVDDLTSYTTDAMAVTHGDKPFKNIGETIDRLKDEQNVIWTRMVRYNQLGVSG